MMQKGVSVAVCMLWLHAGGVAKQGITGLFYTIIIFFKFSIDEFGNSKVHFRNSGDKRLAKKQKR